MLLRVLGGAVVALGLFAAPATAQSADVLAPARTGQLQCFEANVAAKTCQTIGRYEILAVLGQGGFGITYRARDVQLDREVAIKEYLPSALAVRQDGATVLPRSTRMADDFGWGRDRFVTEGRTLASLHRVPAIVQVFDFLEANGTAYIVMELLSGETLEDRIKKNGKPAPVFLKRGDVMKLGIEGLGSQTQKVVAFKA